MKIRGERECTDCGTRWSYYETGSVGCPACGSLRSVGVDDPTEHTNLETPFDLTPVRGRVDDAPIEDLASRARERCSEYVRHRGFLTGGRLDTLDDTYLAATELLHVADVLSRTRRLTEDEELYFLRLLRDADDGQRPPAESVPGSFRGARGLAYADAVREYRRDVRTWMADRTVGSEERSTFELLGEHVKRIRMLDGDVTPRTAETLVEAMRELSTALEGTDDVALDGARSRLESLARAVEGE